MSSKHIETPFGMNLPCKVMIGAVPYLVKDNPHMEDFGDCNFDRKVISINVAKHLTLPQLLVTWHHETGHAIANEFGVPLSEGNCDRMAQGRTQAHVAWMEAQ